MCFYTGFSHSVFPVIFNHPRSFRFHVSRIFSFVPFRPHFTAFLSAFAFCLPFSIILVRSVFNHPRSFRLSSLYYHSGGCGGSPFLCVRLSVDQPFSQLLFLVGGCTLQIHCQLFGLINFCHFFNFSTYSNFSPFATFSTFQLFIFPTFRFFYFSAFSTFRPFRIFDFVKISTFSTFRPCQLSRLSRLSRHFRLFRLFSGIPVPSIFGYLSYFSAPFFAPHFTDFLRAY